MQGTVSTWYGRPFSAGMAAFAGISVYYGRLVVQRTRAGITAMTSMAAYNGWYELQCAMLRIALYKFMAAGACTRIPSTTRCYGIYCTINRTGSKGCELSLVL